MTLEIGIALALVCAFVTNLGFLLKHRGACEAPAVDIRHPLRSAVALFRSRYFIAGYAVAGVAFVIHVAALWMAPISVVQSVISGGLVFLAVIAERMFGYKLGGRQWAGVILTAIGMMLLAITLPQHGPAGFSLSALIAFEAGALCVGILLLLGPRLGGAHRHTGVLLGAASGVLIGVSDIAIKAMTDIASDSSVMSALMTPWLPLAVAMAIVSFYSVARGLQVGEAVPVITMIGVTANLTQIIGGIIVFADPMPGNALGMIGQMFGFMLVCAAAVLVPAPTRAAQLEPASA
jgi:drug/metabolite transporter (DMT)-like permease